MSHLTAGAFIMTRPPRPAQRPAPPPPERDRALWLHSLLGAMALSLRLREPAHPGVELSLDSFRTGPFLGPQLASLARVLVVDS